MRRRIDILKYDLATAEKLPVIRDLLVGVTGQPCLDVGSGTGDLTAEIYAGRAPIALDAWLPNLHSAGREFGSSIRLLNGSGDKLPLRAASVGTVLCSEVLEHIEDDLSVVREMARVLRPGGHLIVTVPSLYFGTDSYLRLFGVRTVHDFPGPEQHVRRGYREEQLRQMIAACGLEIERVVYMFRPVSKLAIDFVSAAHLLYQRVVLRRSHWSWSDVTESDVQNSALFKVYRLLYPLLRLASVVDRALRFRGGFGVAVRARRTS